MPISEQTARPLWAVCLLAIFYIFCALVIGIFVGCQLASSLADAQQSSEQLPFGNELPQGETVLPSGDKYSREGNLVTYYPRDGGEPLGWYVGDDPRAKGGGIGTGPGRVSWEIAVGASVVIAVLLGTALCLLLRRPWAWNIAYGTQTLLAAFGLLIGIAWCVFTLWALVQNGLGGGIGLMLMPFTVGVPCLVAGVAAFGRRYLRRPYVRAKYKLAN